MRVLPNPREENGSERHTTQRRAGHRHLEAGRGRVKHGGVVPTTWDRRADLLAMEGEIRWDGKWGCEEAEAIGGREPETEARGGGADAG